MAVNETIVTNRYFRRCTDAANKVWQRISFWHKASDCEFDDGSTAQTKVGAIKGITTSTSVTETGYAADMTTVKGLQTQIDELNSNLGGKIGSFNGKTEKTFNYPSSAKYLVLENTGMGTYATFGMLLIDLSNKKFVGCTVSSNGTSYPSYGTNYNDTIHVVDFDNHTITQKIGTNNWTGMPLDVYAL